MPVTVSDDPIAVDAGEPCEECCEPTPEPSDCITCCDPPPPARLWATFTGLSPSPLSSSCGCFVNSVAYPLDYVTSPSGACRWVFLEGSPTSGDPLCQQDTGEDICTHSIVLDCVLGGTWSLVWAWGDSVNGCTSGLATYSADDTGSTFLCDPLEITFEGFTGNTGAVAAQCGTLSGITVTITE